MFHRHVRLWSVSTSVQAHTAAYALDPPASETSRANQVEKAIRSERRRLLEFIRSRVDIPEDAEDILQDVLVQLMASDSIAAPIEKFTSWLFTVARNRIVDWYRKRKPEPISSLAAADTGDEGEDGAPFFLENALFDPSDNPDAAYFRERFWDALAEALEELPAEQRDAFVMHELEGRSFKEIAEATGVGVPTLLSRKRYAVAYLRVRLRDLYDELNNVE